MLYDQMNEELKKGGFELKVSDKNSYQLVAKALREKTGHEDRVEKKILLDEMIKDILSLCRGLGNIGSK